MVRARNVYLRRYFTKNKISGVSFKNKIPQNSFYSRGKGLGNNLL